MNKYINFDISEGITSIKVGLMNAIKSVFESQTKKIIFEKHIPVSLVLECCKLSKIPTEGFNEYLSNWKLDYKDFHIFGIYKTGYLKITHD